MAVSTSSLFFSIFSLALLCLATSHLSNKDLSEMKADYLKLRKEADDNKTTYKSGMTRIYKDIDMYLSFIRSTKLLVDVASLTGNLEPLEVYLEKEKAEIEEVKETAEIQDAVMETKFEENEQHLQLMKNYISLLESVQSEL